MTDQEKNVAVKSTTDIVNGTSRRGFEEQIDKDDLIFPRAKIHQGTPVEQEQFPDASGGEVPVVLSFPGLSQPVAARGAASLLRREYSPCTVRVKYEKLALDTQARARRDANASRMHRGNDGSRPAAVGLCRRAPSCSG